MMLEHLRRMARYNHWANERLYDACAALSDAARKEERGAFFGSLHRTLEHILIGDAIWLERIAGAPPGDWRLDQAVAADFETLRARRRAEDQAIVDRLDAADDASIAAVARYRMITKPGPVETPVALCWLHLFNHQTHHRGQCHAMLSQAGAAAPPLDLIFYLRETEAR